MTPDEVLVFPSVSRNGDGSFQVFVSHSIDPDAAPDAAPPTVMRFVDDVQKALATLDPGRAGRVGFDFDQNIETTDEWRARIWKYIVGAHAAIILLTKHSVTRPWVQDEATALATRREEGGLAGIIQVELEAGAIAELAKERPSVVDGLANLGALQALRNEALEELVDKTAAALLKLVDWRSSSDGDWNAGLFRLVHVLAKYYLGDDGNRRLAELLHDFGGDAASAVTGNRALALAELLVVACLLKNPDGIRAAAGYEPGIFEFATIAKILNQAADRGDFAWAVARLKEIASFWPDPRAAATLKPAPSAAGDVVEYRAVSFTDLQVLDWYIQRAYLKQYNPPEIVQLRGAEDEFDAEYGAVSTPRPIAYFHVPLADWSDRVNVLRMIEDYPWGRDGAEKRIFIFSVDSGAGEKPDELDDDVMWVLPALSPADEKRVLAEARAAMCELQPRSRKCASCVRPVRPSGDTEERERDSTCAGYARG